MEAAHDWAASMNKRHQTDLILLDFSKAFDCVPHQRLLHKLNYYGISGPTLYWIKSFLSDRTQHVSINGSHSALANVTSGVPQGSVLGPVLFLLYINDITNQIQSNIRLFADDSIVYREIRSPADHQILQTDIQMLTDWSKKWQMNFNTSKCHLLTITHKPKPSEFTYTISNQPISRVNSHPYLEVNHRCQTIMEQAYTRHSIQICQDTWSTQTNPISCQTESKGGSLQYTSKTDIRIWINSLEPTYPE